MRDGAKSKKLGPFLRQNWMPVGLLVGSLAVAMWFGVQVFLDGLYFNDPNNVAVDLRSGRRRQHSAKISHDRQFAGAGARLWGRTYFRRGRIGVFGVAVTSLGVGADSR